MRRCVTFQWCLCLFTLNAAIAARESQAELIAEVKKTACKLRCYAERGRVRETEAKVADQFRSYYLLKDCVNAPGDECKKCESRCESHGDIARNGTLEKSGPENQLTTKPVLHCREFRDDSLVELFIRWNRTDAVEGPLAVFLGNRSCFPSETKSECEAKNFTYYRDPMFHGMFPINVHLGTRIQLKLVAVSPLGVMSAVPPQSDWIDAGAPPSVTPPPVTWANVTKFIVQGERLSAVVRWLPNADFSCSYKLFWMRDTGKRYYLYDLGETPWETAFVHVLQGLHYDSNYHVDIIALSSDPRRRYNESPKYTVSFSTPSCLEANHYNLSVCKPPPPRNLIVSLEGQDVAVTWKPPRGGAINPSSREVDGSPILNYELALIDTAFPALVPIQAEVNGTTLSYRFKGVVDDPTGSRRSRFEVRVCAVSVAGKGDDIVEVLNLAPSSLFSKFKGRRHEEVGSPLLLLSVLLMSLIVALGILYGLKSGLKQRKIWWRKKYLKGRSAHAFNPTYEKDVEVPTVVVDAFEVRGEELELFETIGEGAFGVVKRGLLSRGPQPEVVAVKMLKPNAAEEDRRALINEFEVMKNIPKHDFLVNLLAAVTVTDSPCLVLEFCPLGDLRSYLVAFRKELLQMSLQKTRPVTTTYQPKPQIGDEHSPAEAVASEGSSVCSGDIEYTVLPSASGELWNGRAQVERMASLNDSGVVCQSVSTSSSRESVAFGVDQMLSIAWQVSKGMEFLANNKIIHRDLATRNVLMVSEQRVKISDFGMSRDVYERNLYRMKQSGRIDKLCFLRAECVFVSVTMSDSGSDSRDETPSPKPRSYDKGHGSSTSVGAIAGRDRIYRRGGSPSSRSPSGSPSPQSSPPRRTEHDLEKVDPLQAKLIKIAQDKVKTAREGDRVLCSPFCWKCNIYASGFKRDVASSVGTPEETSPLGPEAPRDRGQDPPVVEADLEDIDPGLEALAGIDGDPAGQGRGDLAPETATMVDIMVEVVIPLNAMIVAEEADLEAVIATGEEEEGNDVTCHNVVPDIAPLFRIWHRARFLFLSRRCQHVGGSSRHHYRRHRRSRSRSQEKKSPRRSTTPTEKKSSAASSENRVAGISSPTPLFPNPIASLLAPPSLVTNPTLSAAPNAAGQLRSPPSPIDTSQQNCPISESAILEAQERARQIAAQIGQGRGDLAPETATMVDIMVEVVIPLNAMIVAEEADLEAVIATGEEEEGNDVTCHNVVPDIAPLFRIWHRARFLFLSRRCQHVGGSSRHHYRRHRRSRSRSQEKKSPRRSTTPTEKKSSAAPPENRVAGISSPTPLFPNPIASLLAPPSLVTNPTLSAAPNAAGQLRSPPSPIDTSQQNCPISESAILEAQERARQIAAQIGAKVKSANANVPNIPSYYNPEAVDTTKIAAQVQKRKLLWSKKEDKTPTKTLWSATTFDKDDQGKVSAKFKKLMGIKDDDSAGTSS
ncbi:unnamed protein product, partial [Cyprideis torosa]